MINSIFLENFKAFQNNEIKASKITILTGPNGGGKTSAIQALMLLKQTNGSTNLKYDGDIVNLNSWQEITNIHNIPLKIGYSASESGGIQTSFTKQIAVKIGAEFRDGELVNMLSFVSDGEIELSRKADRDVREQFEVKWKSGQLTIIPNLNMTNLFAYAGKSSLQQSELGPALDYIQHLGQSPKRIMEEIEFVPIDRGFRSSAYPLGDKATDHFKGTQNIEAYESSMATTLEYKRDDIEDALSDWMNEITGVRIKAPLQEGKLINIFAKRGGKDSPKMINIAFEGFGSNQLIFILVPLAQQHYGSTLIIEEPEMHLHPGSQAKLVKVLLGACKDKDIQLILTTHSEHIVAAILTAVARKQYLPSEVAINYLHREGETTVSDLIKVDEYGRIEGGLPCFFEANIEEAENHFK